MKVLVIIICLTEVQATALRNGFVEPVPPMEIAALPPVLDEFPLDVIVIVDDEESFELTGCTPQPPCDKSEPVNPFDHLTAFY